MRRVRKNTEFWSGSQIKQDSQAIQYMSEVVNDTILKYIKTVIICFG